MSYTLCGASNANAAVAAGVTNYVFIGAGSLALQTTEAPAQRKVRKTGTFSLLTVRVLANTLSGNCTVRFRKGAVNGNQVVTIGSGLTGVFSDTTNSDAVTSGTDLINYSVVADAGTGSISLCIISTIFNLSGNSCTAFYGADNIGAAFPTTASISRFIQPCASILASVTVEAQAAPIIDVAGTFRNLQCYVVSNTRTTATTITSRKNSAAGAQTISIGAGATGFFEDTTHTDSVVATNTFDIAYTSGTGAGVLTVAYVGVEFDSTVAFKHQLFTFQATAVTTAVRDVAPFGAGAVTTNASGPFGFGVKVTNSRAYVSANTRDATETISSTLVGSPNAGSTTALSISVGATVTGELHDTTHNDIVYANDNYCSVRSNSDSVGSYQTQWFALTIEHIILADAAPTIAAFTSSAAGTVEVHATSAQTFGNFTSAGVGTVEVHATAAKTIAPFTSSAAGTVEVHATEAKTIDAFTSSAAGTVEVHATSTKTIDAFTSSATGTVEVHATVAKTFANFTSTAIGTVEVHATVAKTFDNFTSSATVAVIVAATVAQTFDNFTGSATDQVIVGATEGGTFDNFTASAAGTVLVQGTLNEALDNFIASAAGTVLVKGTLNETFDDFTSSAIGTVLVQGSFDKTIDPFTSTATVTVLVKATVAQSFADFTSAATGKVIVSAHIAATIPNFTCSATGTVIVDSDTTVVMPNFTSDGSAEVIIDGQADVTMSNFTTRAKISIIIIDANLLNLQGKQSTAAALIGKQSTADLIGTGSFTTELVA